MAFFLILFKVFWHLIRSKIGKKGKEIIRNEFFYSIDKDDNIGEDLVEWHLVELNFRSILDQF